LGTLSFFWPGLRKVPFNLRQFRNSKVGRFWLNFPYTPRLFEFGDKFGGKKFYYLQGLI